MAIKNLLGHHFFQGSFRPHSIKGGELPGVSCCKTREEALCEAIYSFIGATYFKKSILHLFSHRMVNPEEIVNDLFQEIHTEATSYEFKTYYFDITPSDLEIPVF